MRLVLNLGREVRRYAESFPVEGGGVGWGGVGGVAVVVEVEEIWRKERGKKEGKLRIYGVHVILLITLFYF